MSDRIEEYKRDLERLNRRIDILKETSGKDLILHLSLRSISVILSTTAPLLLPKKKIASTVFNICSKLIDLFLKRKEEFKND